MSSITLPCVPLRTVTTFDRFLLASSAALVALVERRHDTARIERLEHVTTMRRDAAAVRHLGLLPR